MRIAFGDISRAKIRHTIHDSSWLPQGEIEVAAPLTAEISLRLTGEDTVTLEGVLHGTLRLECARCGDPVMYGLNEQFLYLITTREEEISALQERECSAEECDTLYLQEPIIDVAEILLEQLHLAIPGKVLCNVDCRGLCPQCGGSYKRNECTCGELEPDSPFKVLQQLKK